MKPKNSKVALSIVIPLFNEEKLIAILVKELNKVITKIKKPTEVIFVNDGSKDSTEKNLMAVKLVCKKVIISFSRNFGHQSALLAGLEIAKGKYVVTMDGDLQHPPSLIPEMLNLHAQGYDIVLTHRYDQNTTGFIKKNMSRFFYFVLNTVSETKIEVSGSDFRSMSRRALETLLQLPEQRKFLRGMVHWIGYKTIVLPFKAKKRAIGQSKYTTLKMLRLGFDGITSFSTLPLYFSGFIGLLLFLFAFLYGLYVLFVRFILQDAVDGWASVLFVLLIVGGSLSLFFTVLGIYIAALYDEVKKRPNYITKEIIK